MRRRSNLLVLLGLASFVLGLVAVYLITDDDDSGTASSNSDRVAVLVASEDLPNGALGDDLIASGQVRVEQIPVDQRSGDALTSPSQLSGTRLTASFLEGEQIRFPGVQSLGGARAEIPEGYEAVALTMDFVAGGANTIIPRDRVNVFLNQASISPTEIDSDLIQQQGARVQLLLTNALVLDVQQGNPNLLISSTADAAADTPTTLTVVLAVSTVDAEKLIYGSDTEGNTLYLTRVRADEEGDPAPPSSGDPGGRVFVDVLAEAPLDAAGRSNG